MKLYQEIEQTRIELGLSVCAMCDILNMGSVAEYEAFQAGRCKLSMYQLISYVCAVQRPIQSIKI